MDELVRQWVRADFGVDLAGLERVRHGADVAAEVWRGVTVDGARYAVKWSSGGSVSGLLVPALLARRGMPGIVAPVPAVSGSLWTVREGRRLSLVPWADGTAALDGMTDRHWVSYGALLARAHATAVTGEAAEHLPRERYEHDRFAAMARALPGRLRQPADELAEALAAEWHASAEVIGTVLARADELAVSLRPRPARHVLCHADPHLGNVLVRGDDHVWLIDWDDAMLAPPERDLMFVFGGVLAFAPVGDRERALFFAGYGPAEVDPGLLAYYQCARAVEDLAELAVQVLDGSGRAEALELFRGMFSPTGLATLALEAAAQAC